MTVKTANTIEVYRDSDTTYSFPTVPELVEAITDDFRLLDPTLKAGSAV